MTKLTTIDKKALIALRPEIDAALVELGQRLGVTFHAGNGSYGAGTEGSFKLQITIDDPEALAAKAKADFAGMCHFFGLRPEDFGTEFVSGGTQYRVTGLAVGRSKYPIRVEVLSGAKKGRTVFFQELAAPAIRAATDAKAKAPAKAA